MAAKEKIEQEIQVLKKGFEDIQLVAQEGNFKLFAKQIVAVVIVYFLFYWANGKFSDTERNLKGQIEAIRVQQTSEREYSSSKQQLLDLEPRFPDLASKNEWLISHIMETFKEQGLTPTLDGTQKEDTTNNSYTVASYTVGLTVPFESFAKLLAAFESKEEYVKLSQFDLTKTTEGDDLGKNKVSLTLNTIFPKEKLAPKLFKNGAAKKNKGGRK